MSAMQHHSMDLAQFFCFSFVHMYYFIELIHMEIDFQN